MNTIWIILLSAVGGAALTGGSIFLITNKKTEPVVVQNNAVVAEKKIEIVKQLTNTDLLAIPCGKDYLKLDEGLCREMFCRMNEKGIDSSVSSSECSAISNLLNTKVILTTCKDYTGDQYTDCIRLFRERK